MNKRQRNILQRLMQLANDLGGVLDGTSTHESKYKDRQQALSKVYRIVYAVLADHPENDHREHDYELAEEAIKHLEELKAKVYPDKKGNY